MGDRTHRDGGRHPNGIDDFKEGLNFNEINSPFDNYKPNTPILNFVEGEAYPYRGKIGDVTLQVFLKQGGDYHQRLITRIPVTDIPDRLSNSLYLLPFKFGPDTHKYVTYHAEKWWNPDGSPRIVPGMTTEKERISTRPMRRVLTSLIPFISSPAPIATIHIRARGICPGGFSPRGQIVLDWLDLTSGIPLSGEIAAHGWERLVQRLHH